MTDTNTLIDLNDLSEGEKTELQKLGMLTGKNSLREYRRPEVHKNRPPLPKDTVHAPGVLNEAFNYAKPSSFSRALKLELGGYRILIVSGTASVNENGKCEYPGDFRAQTWRTFRNIDTLLKADEMSWHDVVRTTCYLRDMSRDYGDFNKIRTSFYRWHQLDPLPASTGVQSILCWPELLVEIEAWAICKI